MRWVINSEPSQPNLSQFREERGKTLVANSRLAKNKVLTGNVVVTIRTDPKELTVPLPESV